jgi:hypothetical protein
MLQVQFGGPRGTSLFHLSRLQPRQGGDEIEEVAESFQNYTRKGVLMRPHWLWIDPGGGVAQQQLQPRPSPVAVVCRSAVGETSDMPPLKHNQQVPSQFRLLMQTVSSPDDKLFQIISKLNRAE